MKPIVLEPKYKIVKEDLNKNSTSEALIRFAVFEKVFLGWRMISDWSSKTLEEARVILNNYIANKNKVENKEIFYDKFGNNLDGTPNGPPPNCGSGVSKPRNYGQSDEWSRKVYIP